MVPPVWVHTRNETKIRPAALWFSVLYSCSFLLVSNWWTQNGVLAREKKRGGLCYILLTEAFLPIFLVEKKPDKDKLMRSSRITCSRLLVKMKEKELGSRSETKRFSGWKRNTHPAPPGIGWCPASYGIGMSFLLSQSSNQSHLVAKSKTCCLLAVGQYIR